MASGERWARRLDLAIPLLLVAAATWVLFAGRYRGGETAPIVALLIGTAVVLWLARRVAGVIRWLVPLGVATAVSVLALAHIGDLPSRGPLTGALGYANVSGTLYLQGAIAALMVAVSARGTMRLVGAGTSVGLTIATVLAGSDAARLLLLAPVVALLAAIVPRWSRPTIAALSVTFALTLSASVGVAAIGPGAAEARGPTGIVDRVLTQRRALLWSEAFELMAGAPVLGVGPGNFEAFSETARSDRDARWAHHGFLQFGAETGVPGLLILSLVFGLAFVRLWLSGDPMAALGASSLAALGMHACVDYVLHFPAVPLAAAALVGAAQSVPLRRFPRGEREHREEGVESAPHTDGVARAQASG